MFRFCLSMWCISLIAASIFAQQQALSPHSMYEPPAAKDAASLAASSAGVTSELRTTGVKTNWRETGVYAEAVSLMQAMEKRSPYVKVGEFGTTSEGRAMYAMVVSRD